MFERWVKMAYYSPVGMIKIAHDFSKGATGKAMLLELPWLKDIGDEWWETAASLYDNAILGAPLSEEQSRKAIGTRYAKARYLIEHGTKIERQVGINHIIEAISTGAPWTIAPAGIRKTNIFLTAAREHLRLNVLNYEKDNTTGLKVSGMPYDIFDQATKDILVYCEWFCLEVVNHYDGYTRIMPPLWITDNWKQKVRLSGTIKDNGDRLHHSLNMRAHKFYNLPVGRKLYLV